MQLLNHHIGSNISDSKEHQDTDHKIHQIPCQPGLHGHGNPGQKFQIAKGMKPQMHNSCHGKGTSLQNGIHSIKRQRTEHKHKLQRFGYAGQKHGQHRRNKHRTIGFLFILVHSAVHS